MTQDWYIMSLSPKSHSLSIFSLSSRGKSVQNGFTLGVGGLRAAGTAADAWPLPPTTQSERSHARNPPCTEDHDECQSTQGDHRISSRLTRITCRTFGRYQNSLSEESRPEGSTSAPPNRDCPDDPSFAGKRPAAGETHSNRITFSQRCRPLSFYRNEDALSKFTIF